MLSSALPPGCKVPSIKQPVKLVSSRLSRPSLVARSTSLSSVPQLTMTTIDGPPRFKPTSSPSPVISIPSPPLTPHVRYDPGKNEDEDENEDESDIFSSRFRWQQQQHDIQGGGQEDLLSSSLLKHSSSAPSEMSPLEMRALSSGVKTGFTFSSNLTPSLANKEDHHSYECFVNKMEEDYWKSVSTIRTTYFFDGIGRGGGFLAIPHLASHGNAKTNVICRLLEAWLTEKLVEPTISDSIPVLEDNIQSSVQSIEQHLRQDLKVWTGISKSFIHIQCGHVFMLDTCCDDNTIVHLGADEFYQDYPLFVDVEIKMHCDGGQQAKESSTEVMIAFKNVVNRDKTKDQDRPYVHRAVFSEPRRRQSQDDNHLVA
ncbi:hypothetical protein BGZ70_003428 [Mortierella alpina]|uniref:Uncharacterized protein n=1 Tax=Mortierella alpina TaxID=64518 RepID=A0A9P6ISG8_MORAP|nr:hypothetical protein BGZ70_003428 [Mortierella alpina]